MSIGWIPWCIAMTAQLVFAWQLLSIIKSPCETRFQYAVKYLLGVGTFVAWGVGAAALLYLGVRLFSEALFGVQQSVG